MNLKIRTFCMIIFNLVLFMGCFWQIFKVCKLYFNYPTNIFIDMKFNTLTKRLPAITLCTNTGGNQGENSSDALENASKLYKDKMFGHISEKKNGNTKDRTSEFLVFAIERISKDKMIFYPQGMQSIELRFTDRLTIKLDKFGIYNSWWLFLHHYNDVPSSSEWNAIEVKKGWYQSMTWKLSNFQLLESPYSTDCRNYSSATDPLDKHLSRRDCVRKCKLKASLDKCNGSSSEVDFERGEESVPFATDNNCINQIDFDSLCLTSCPQYDCYIDYYKPLGVSQNFENINHAALDLAIPTEPEMSYIYEPRIETVEFVCYLASTMSMWFGLSVYSVYDLILLFRNRLMSKVQNKFKINNKLNLFVKGRGVPSRFTPSPKKQPSYRFHRY